MSQTQTQQLFDVGMVDSGYGSLLSTPECRTEAMALSTLDSSTTAMPASRPPNDSYTINRDTICGMRIFNKDICEEIHKRFRDVLNRLAEPLDTYLRKGRKSRKEYKATAIRLMPLGYDENSVLPWIVVICPAPVKKRAEKFFKQDLARRLCQPDQFGIQNFEVAVVGHALKIKGSQKLEEITVLCASSDNVRDFPWSQQIKVDHHGVTRFATMGGFVVATDADGIRSFYGLTAGHVVDYVDEEYQVELEERSNESFSSSDDDWSEPEDELEDEKFDYTNESEDTQPPEEELHWMEIGHLAPSTFSELARNRDWALIEVKQESLSFTEMHQHHSRRISLGIVGQERTLTIGTRNDSSSYHCDLSTLQSMVKLPSGQKFVWAHSLRILAANTESLPSGSSGTWVTSESTDENGDTEMKIYGQIVAEDLYGNIYMVPLKDILDDIRTELKSVVELPNSTFEPLYLLDQVTHWSAAKQIHLGDSQISEPNVSKFSSTTTDSGVVLWDANDSDESDDGTPWEHQPLGKALGKRRISQRDFTEPKRPTKKARTNLPWTISEEQTLRELHEAGNSWSEISKNFPTRTEESIKKHWYKDMPHEEIGKDESGALLESFKENQREQLEG